MSCISCLLRPFAPVLLASIGAAAMAQPHQISRDGYTLRSSTVASTAIDRRTAQAHGIEPSASRGVLNVLVQRTGDAPSENVQADVSAVARNLAGMERQIPMRPAIAENGMVSYLGTYEFLPREVLEFTVTARPRDTGIELSLKFEDRLPAYR